jgi:ribonuclease P/MRP protein subunit RPP40
LNARSLAGKLPDFDLFCASNSFDIVCVTESWLSLENFSDALLSQKGKFSVFRHDRTSRGGGVCVLTNSLFTNVSPIDLPNLSTFSNHFECVAVDIIIENVSFRLICIYRPPNCTFQGTHLMCQLLVSLFNTDSRILLVGDFNLPKIDWVSCSATASGSHEVFLSTVIANSFHQFVSKPTLGNNCLDLVLCNDLEFIISCDIAPPFSTSDHDSVVFSIDVSPPVAQAKSKYYDFFTANFDHIDAKIASVDWGKLLSACSSTDACYVTFTDIITTIIRDNVPFRKRVIKPYSYPCKVVLLTKLVKSPWRKRNASRRARLSFRNASVYLKKVCKRAKALHENRLICSGNLNKFYAYVNRKLNSRSDIGTIVDANGTACVDDVIKCQLFSEQFSSVYVQDDGVVPHFPLRNTGAFRFSLLTELSVYNVLCRLPCKISTSPDGIPYVFLKKAALSLARPLCIIFNRSLLTGEVPDLFKTAFVRPVFKKGKKSVVSNYRPISLTSCVSKVFERIIVSQLLPYLLRKKLLTKCQFGFLPRLSTGVQLLSCFNKWHRLINSGKFFDCLYIDYQKAFDSVSTPKLLQKLRAYGICDTELLWFSNFLRDRTQRVLIGKDKSASARVLSGIPQGTCAGPVMFLLYINDLPDCVPASTNCALFADDVKAFSSNCATFQNSVDCISEWSKIWQLSIAHDKCFVLHFGNGNPFLPVSIDNAPINAATVSRDLGILVSSDLSFDSHIISICKRASQRANLILRAFSSFDVKLLFRAFTVYVRPLLEYCPELWCPCDIFHVNLIEKVQRNFTKRAFARAGNSQISYPERLLSLNAQSLEHRRGIFDLSMVFKLLNGLVNADPKDFFSLKSHLHNTRGHNKRLSQVHVKAKKTLSQFFSNRVIPVWNNLPQAVIDAKSVDSFKAKLNLLPPSNIVPISHLRL